MELRRFLLFSEDIDRELDFLSILGMRPTVEGEGWTGFTPPRPSMRQMRAPIVEVISRQPLEGFRSAPGFQVSRHQLGSLQEALGRANFRVTESSRGEAGEYFFVRNHLERDWQFFTSP